MRILLHDLLLDTASRTPGQTALICEGRTVSFAELARMAANLAARLQDMGVRRHARVLLLLENSIEMVASVFAVSMAGGAFVPIHPQTKPEKLSYLIKDCEPSAIVAAATLAPVVASAVGMNSSVRGVVWVGQGATCAAPHGVDVNMAEAVSGVSEPVRPDLIDQDLAAIIYTSGSTGEPKGVMLTHRNLTNTAWAISSYLGNRPDDVVLCVLPLSFDYGLFQVLTGARVGFTVVLEKSFAFPALLLDWIETHRITGLPGVPTLFAALLRLAPFTGRDLSSLRYLTNTAAALPPAHIRRLKELLPAARLFSMYGLTECTRVSWLDPGRSGDKIGSVGRAMPNSEVYVIDAEGRRLPPGQVGELVVRGANVMRGYWRKPEATARRLRDGEIPGEKVLHTGDLFRMDEEGFLYFVGRQDDVFKCRGEKVCPKEVEHALCELEGVAEAVIVPVPDPMDGMAVKAVVVPRPGIYLTEAEVRAHCRARLESHLVPRFVELRTTLPLSENGKVRRAVLAAGAGAMELPAE